MKRRETSWICSGFFIYIMKTIQLQNAKGLPYFLQCLPKKNNQRQIDFVDTETANVGDTINIGANIFKISEIKEVRISGLDYGVKEDVLWHSTICDVVSLNGNKK